jgi:hypothetical protein
MRKPHGSGILVAPGFIPGEDVRKKEIVSGKMLSNELIIFRTKWVEISYKIVVLSYSKQSAVSSA